MVISKLSLSYVIEDIVTIAENNTQLNWLSFQEPLSLIGLVSLGILVSVFINSQAWRYFSVRFQANTIDWLFERIQQKDYAYFINTHTGRIAHKVAEVPRSSLLAIDTTIHTILRINLNIFVGVVMLSLENIFVGAVAFGWLILFFAFCLYTGLKCGNISNRVSNIRGIVSGHTVDSITNILNVRLFSNADFEEKNLKKYLKHYIRFGDVLYHFQCNMLVQAKALAVLFLVIIAAILIQNLINGTASLAESSVQFTLLIIMFNNMENLPFNIRTLMTDIGVVQEGLDLLKLNENQAENRDNEEDSALKISNGLIEFKGVEFDYSEQKTVFNHFNLNIPAKQKVGLIGPSGAGKSTLVNLLLRFFDVQKGQILIDGQNIADVTQKSLRENIAVIPQDTSLFHRSLIENIRYGRLDASDEEVLEAAQKAHAHEFISELPDGYETLVGERGVKLSGGQRQRIAIARAILKDAPILILDEATSALDSESERLIQDSLKNLMEGKTVIAIAHRLSTIAHLDRLVVMNEGKIVEDGTHDELLEQDGLYAKLWAMQSGGVIG